MKDQPLRTVDDLIAEIRGKSIEEIANEPFEGPHLISVDELRAAGALEVPASWRKSLGGESDLFSNVREDASPRPNEPSRVKVDIDDEAPSDEGVRPQAHGAKRSSDLDRAAT